MAAKHLVNWPSKKTLGVGCIALESALKATSKAYQEWGLPGTLGCCAWASEDVACAEANYRTAKKALVTTAAVNCLANMTGAQKLEKRDQLMQKQEEFLPELLIKALSAALK